MLFEELQYNQVGACGTLRFNRRGVPAEAASAKLVKGHDAQITRDGTLAYINWRDHGEPKWLNSRCHFRP